MRTKLLKVAVVCSLFFANSSFLSAEPILNWTPASETVRVFPGGVRIIRVSFKTSVALRNTRVLAVPALRSYVSVSQSLFLTVGAGESRDLVLTVRIPRGTALGTIEGTLHLITAKGVTLAKPFSLVLQIIDAQPAIDSLESFLIQSFGTLSPSLTHTGDLPTREELPQDILDAFREGSDGAIVLGLGSPILKLTSSFTPNTVLKESVSELLSLVAMKGITVDALRAALIMNDFHREITDVDGLALSRWGVDGVTFLPIPKPLNMIPTDTGSVDFILVVDLDTHSIYKAADTDSLILNQFVQGAGLLSTAASTALHELTHAMIFRTACLSGSADTEETLVVALEGTINAKFVGNEPLLLQSQNDAIAAGGTNCLELLGLSPATHVTQFDFALDSLSVAGNVNSGLGFFDDFNDSSLTTPPTSNFNCNLNTAPVSESGGFLHLSSTDGANTFTPGALVDNCFLGLDATAYRFNKGSGGATIIASFRADAPLPAQAYGLQLFTVGTNELVSIFATNNGAGPVIGALTKTASGVVTVENVALNLTSAQRVFLRLTYNDTTNQVIQSFSTNCTTFTTVSVSQPGTVMTTGSQAITSVFGSVQLPTPP